MEVWIGESKKERKDEGERLVGEKGSEELWKVDLGLEFWCSKPQLLPKSLVSGWARRSLNEEFMNWAENEKSGWAVLSELVVVFMFPPNEEKEEESIYVYIFFRQDYTEYVRFGFTYSKGYSV